MHWNEAALLAALAMAYVLYVHVQANSRAWATWTLRLSHSRRSFFEWLRGNTAEHLAMLADTLRLARARHQEGQDAKALHVLGEAHKLAALHVHLLRRWLRIWADMMDLMQLAPAAPPVMRVAPAGVPPLRGLCHAARLGDLLLPTHAARFRLSVWLQRAALRCVAWDAGATRLRARQPGQIAAALAALESTQATLVALDDQVLATLARVVEALPPHSQGVHGGRVGRGGAVGQRAVSR